MNDPFKKTPIFYGDNESFIPTPDSLIKAKLELATLVEGDMLMDLGCGDARVLIEAVQQHSIMAMGVDIDQRLVEQATNKVAAAGLSNRIKIIHQDFLSTDLSQATVLILYLTRNSLGQLSMKLEKELKPGTRIITHQFDLPAWTSMRTSNVQLSNGSNETLYLYKK